MALLVAARGLDRSRVADNVSRSIQKAASLMDTAQDFALTTEVHPEPQTFRRDGPTPLAYGAVGAIAFWLYAFGPALALLRHELHLSYSVVGLYSALYAAGAVIVGFGFPWLARRASRSQILWGAAVAAAIGAAAFVLPTWLAVSLGGVAVLGVGGALIQTVLQSVLSDHHGPRRVQAFVEVNIGAGVTAVLAPLILGGLQMVGLSWRLIMAVPAIGLLGLYLTYRREPMPAPTPSSYHEGGAGRLPLAFWYYAVLIAGGCAIEFCVVYFGAELLASHTGLTVGSAATAMALFYGGLFVGRAVGGALTRQPGRAVKLLVGSLAAVTIGFAAFWLPGQTDVALAGLFITGAGVANLFPLSLSLAMASAPGRTDSANAKTQLLAGVGLVVAPWLLGTAADHLGLFTAFLIVPVLVVLCAVTLYLGLATEAGSRRSRLSWSSLSLKPSAR
jgi:MFS family permease